MPDCLKKKIDQLNKILAPYGARKLSNTELSILDENIYVSGNYLQI